MGASFCHDIPYEIAFAEAYDDELCRITEAVFCDPDLNERAVEAQLYLKDKSWCSFPDLIKVLRAGCPLQLRRFDSRTRLSINLLWERLDDFLLALVGPLAKAVVAARSTDLAQFRAELGENLGIFGPPVQSLGTVRVPAQHVAVVAERREVDHDAFTSSYSDDCRKALQMIAESRVTALTTNIVAGRLMEHAGLVPPVDSPSPDDARNDRVRQAVLRTKKKR